nr:auxin response factor 9-like [Tanacetum cinerariifolium]
IISLNKYIEAINNKFTVGMRFKMPFEGEDSPERRFTGTIVGVEDISPQWEDSKWRSLKVQWDEPASILRPERVSPWEIETFGTPVPTSLVESVAPKCKRPRPPAEVPNLEPACPTASSVWNPLAQISCPLDGQMSDYQRSWRQNQTESLLSSPVMASRNLFIDEMEDQKGLSAWSTQSIQTSVDLKRSESISSFRIFGFDLMSTTKADIIPETAPPLSLGISDQKSDLSKDCKDQGQLQVSPKEVQSKQSTCTRSCTKVQMQGIAVGRAVDLTALKGYDELINELEEMFETKGELHPRNQWEIIFTDDEGDMMLMGDHPWEEFCSMVKRILICSSQDVKKMKVPPLFLGFLVCLSYKVLWELLEIENYGAVLIRILNPYKFISSGIRPAILAITSFFRQKFDESVTFSEHYIMDAFGVMASLEKLSREVMKLHKQREVIKEQTDAYKVIDEMSMNKFIEKYGTVQEYFDSFSSWFSKARFEEWCLVDLFICGLPPDIEKGVSMFKPQTFSDACCLAKLQESTHNFMVKNSNESKGVKNNVGLRKLDVSWKDGVGSEGIKLRVSQRDDNNKCVRVLDDGCAETESRVCGLNDDMKGETNESIYSELIVMEVNKFQDYEDGGEMDLGFKGDLRSLVEQHERNETKMRVEQDVCREDDDFVVCDLVRPKGVDVLGKDYGTGFIKGLEDVNGTSNVSVHASYIDNHPQIVQIVETQKERESLSPTLGLYRFRGNGGILVTELETLNQILQWVTQNSNVMMLNSSGTAGSFEQSFTYGMEFKIEMSDLNENCVHLEEANKNGDCLGRLKYMEMAQEEKSSLYKMQN